MKPFINIFISLVVLIGPSALSAQTVNHGELVISDQTTLSLFSDFENSESGTLINDGELFAYLDFTNNGMVDFSDGSNGSTRFEGSSEQQFAGNQPSYFKHVQINNNSGGEHALNVMAPIRIAGGLDLIQGIINTLNPGASLLLESEATVAHTSDTSFVDGFVGKTGEVAFSFPIGDVQYYRHAHITPLDGGAGEFSARYAYQDPERPYPNDLRIGNIPLVDGNEYWVVNCASGTRQLQLTLGWDETTTTPSEVVTPPHSALRIARWDPIAGAWRDAGGVADPNSRTVTAEVAVGPEGGVFTLARVNEEVILPPDVVVYNAVSPNQNGKNDYLFIENINGLANNSVQVYNRWGTKVFETTDYDRNNNVFRGYANTQEKHLLPSGTYFYILRYDYQDTDAQTQRLEQAGYLYLNTD